MSQDVCPTSIVSGLNTSYSEPLSSIFIQRVKNYTTEVLEHLFILVFCYITLCIILHVSIKWKLISFTHHIKNARRIMIFIAHPDDECMFFGPTILNLLKTSNCTVYLTCFSTGINYGMGKVRKNELYNACKVLGLDEGAIIVRNHSLLPDDICKKWPAELLAKMILRHVETYDIDTIITFDKCGVSQHVNHCSLYYAVAFLCIENLLPPDCRIFTLESINVIRKYWLILDIPLSYILSKYRYILSSSEKERLNLAMQQHKSQILWYRKIYLRFSRYIIINTLQELDPPSIEFDLTIDD